MGLPLGSNINFGDLLFFRFLVFMFITLTTKNNITECHYARNLFTLQAGTKKIQDLTKKPGIVRGLNIGINIKRHFKKISPVLIRT